MRETKRLKQEESKQECETEIKGRKAYGLRTRLLRRFMTKLERYFANLHEQQDGSLREESVILLRERYKIDSSKDFLFDEYRQMVFYYFHTQFGLRDDPNSIFCIFAVFEQNISNKKKDLPQDWLSRKSNRYFRIINSLMVSLIYYCEKVKSVFEEFFDLTQKGGIFKEEIERKESGKFQKHLISLKLMGKSIGWLYEDRKKRVGRPRNFKKGFTKIYDRFVIEMSKQGCSKRHKLSNDVAIAEYIGYIKLNDIDKNDFLVEHSLF